MQAELDFMTPARCSEDALKSVKPCIRTQRQAILEFLQQCGTHGATDNEIQDYLELDGNTVRPRRGELGALGKIRPNGQTRLTPKGRKSAVWVVA